MELNEDFRTAGVREVKEETGLDVEIVAVLDVYSDLEKNVLNIILPGKLLSGEAKADGYEIELVKWFPTSGELPWLGANTAKVRQYLDGNSTGILIEGAHVEEPLIKSLGWNLTGATEF